MLKIVFCIDITAEYMMCRNFSGNTFSTLHRDSPFVANLPF